MRPRTRQPARSKPRIIARRGKEARNIAKVAAARRLLTLVFYGLRDGQIRCLPAISRRPAGDPAACAGGMNSSSWPAARREVASCVCPAALTRRRGRPLD